MRKIAQLNRRPTGAAALIAVSAVICGPSSFATTTDCRKTVDLEGPGFNTVVVLDQKKLKTYLAGAGVVPASIPGMPPGTYGVILAVENHEQNHDERQKLTHAEFYAMIPMVSDGVPGMAFDLLVNGDRNAARRRRSMATWKRNWNFPYQAGTVSYRPRFNDAPVIPQLPTLPKVPSATSRLTVDISVSGPGSNGASEKWLDIKMADRWLDGKLMGQTSDALGFFDMSGTISFVPQIGIHPRHAAAGLKHYLVSTTMAIAFPFLKKAEDTLQFGGRLKDFLIGLGAEVVNGQPVAGIFNYFPEVKSRTYVPEQELEGCPGR